LSGVRGDCFLDLCLHGLHVERRTGLQRRELDGALRRCADDFLDEDEAPELVGEPVVVRERTRKATIFGLAEAAGTMKYSCGSEMM
jgi:hypothetical protein